MGGHICRLLLGACVHTRRLNRTPLVRPLDREEQEGPPGHQEDSSFWSDGDNLTDVGRSCHSYGNTHLPGRCFGRLVMSSRVVLIRRKVPSVWRSCLIYMAVDCIGYSTRATIFVRPDLESIRVPESAAEN